MAVIVVSGCHAQPAPAAYHQARQQRRAGPHRPQTIRSVGAKLRLIAIELHAADVGRHPIRQEYLGFACSWRTPPSARPSRLLPPPVRRAYTIGVYTGVDRIAEQIVQRRPVGAVPFKLALAGAAGGAHRHADVVLDQITQHFADGAKPLEKREHLADRCLCLLIGIKCHLAGGASHVAHRHPLAEFAPPRLGAPARQHPRLENVQFRFRHCPL